MCVLFIIAQRIIAFLTWYYFFGNNWNFLKSFQLNALLKDDIDGPHEDLTSIVVEEDSAALELELALNKARKINTKKLAPVERVKQERMDTESDVRRRTFEQNLIGSSISLNCTSEFCRSLGDIPTFGLAGNREDDERITVSFLLHSFLFFTA